MEGIGSELWLIAGLHVMSVECVSYITGIWLVYLLVNIMGVLQVLKIILLLCISEQIGYIHYKQK
jgi:hypothetical protein